VSPISKVTLDDGTIVFIEIHELAAPDIGGQSSGASLPPGATPTGAADVVVNTFQILKGTLKGVFTAIHSSFHEHAPDEWGAELNIGFKGGTTPIPVLVSGEANVTMKVHAKWTKPMTKAS
jgi:hypothetical protein